MTTEPITLYRKNKLGVGTWRCWAEGATLYVAHAQVVGGSEVVHSEKVPKGLAGRTLEEQVQSRIDSRVNKQRDKGYVDDAETARTQPRTNTLDMPHPMLAKKLSDMRNGWWYNGPKVIQRKYDGFRCLVAKDDEDSVFCYSRQGKVLDALTHIKNALQHTLPEDVILDGEIYEHGKPLQAIASLAKRKQAGTEKLVLHVYDCITNDANTKFLERYEIARQAVEAAGSDSIVMVENFHIETQNEMWELFAEHRSTGYEGSILRVPKFPYEAGCRSSGLIKIKARDDDEFQVIDVVEGKDGNGVLVLKSKSPIKSSFRALAPGTFDQKKFVLHHKDQFIGRWVTVEYPNLTEDMIPFQPVATRWKVEL